MMSLLAQQMSEERETMKKMMNCIDRIGGFVLLACIILGYAFGVNSVSRSWNNDTFAGVIALSAFGIIVFCLFYIYTANALSWKVSKIVSHFWTFCIESFRDFCKWICSD